MGRFSPTVAARYSGPMLGEALAQALYDDKAFKLDALKKRTDLAARGATLNDTEKEYAPGMHPNGATVAGGPSQGQVPQPPPIAGPVGMGPQDPQVPPILQGQNLQAPHLRHDGPFMDQLGADGKLDLGAALGGMLGNPTMAPANLPGEVPGAKAHAASKAAAAESLTQGLPAGNALEVGGAGEAPPMPTPEAAGQMPQTPQHPGMPWSQFMPEPRAPRAPIGYKFGRSDGSYRPWESQEFQAAGESHATAQENYQAGRALYEQLLSQGTPPAQAAMTAMAFMQGRDSLVAGGIFDPTDVMHEDYQDRMGQREHLRGGARERDAIRLREYLGGEYGLLREGLSQEGATDRTRIQQRGANDRAAMGAWDTLPTDENYWSTNPVTGEDRELPFGPPEPRSNASARRNQIDAALQGLDKLNFALHQIGSNPGAFGPGNNFMSNKLAWTYSSEGVRARASVADFAAKIRHDLSGAALSDSEIKYLLPFIPSPEDPPGVARSKLTNFKREYLRILTEKGVDTEALRDRFYDDQSGNYRSLQAHPTTPGRPRPVGPDGRPAPTPRQPGR